MLNVDSLSISKSSFDNAATVNSSNFDASLDTLSFVSIISVCLLLWITVRV